MANYSDTRVLLSPVAPVTVEERTPAPPAPTSFPDGGFLAWIQCAAGFCVFFNTWGLLTSFGTFQTFYATDFLRNSTSSQISWIGTVQSCFIMLGSVYSGPLYDWGYLRYLIFVGSFMLTFGMFMTSLCTDYWQFLLAQGFFMGLGLGCLFTPTVGILATYFNKKRGLAMGIASSGSSVGGIIYPIFFNKMQPIFDFAWTTRFIGFVMLYLSIIPVVGMKQRIKPPAARKIFDPQAWKEPEYTLFALSLTVGYIGMYVPYFYIQLYCLENGIITGELTLYLLAIMNGAGFFGRLFFGKLADIIGPINAFTVASGICSILIFGWIGTVNEGGVLVFAIFYGFCSAGLIILPSTCIAVSLCPDIRQFGVRITMQLVPSAIGLLIGNPIAGAILARGWASLQVFSAVMVLACTVLSGASRVAKVGPAIRGKC